jgi:predicted ATP-dependent Lon-type protease
MTSALLTNYYGLVMDYLAELFRELRTFAFGDAINRYFTLGDALNKRDEKAVRRTVQICVPDYIQISPEDVGKIEANWLSKEYGGEWAVQVFP